MDISTARAPTVVFVVSCNTIIIDQQQRKEPQLDLTISKGLIGSLLVKVSRISAITTNVILDDALLLLF